MHPSQQQTEYNPAYSPCYASTLTCLSSHMTQASFDLYQQRFGQLALSGAVALFPAAAEMESDIYLYGKVCAQILKILKGICKEKKAL